MLEKKRIEIQPSILPGHEGQTGPKTPPTPENESENNERARIQRGIDRIQRRITPITTDPETAQN